MAWTDKMVEDLKIMWKQGLTTGEIGKRLGVSKNSIVGKVHRLQLEARPSPIHKKSEKEQEATVTHTTEKAPRQKSEKKAESTENSAQANSKGSVAPKAVAEKKAVEGNLKLTDLDNHTCRWPIGDPKDENFHFCGKKVRVGQTYCEEHSALAYVKPTKK